MFRAQGHNGVMLLVIVHPRPRSMTVQIIGLVHRRRNRRWPPDIPCRTQTVSKGASPSHAGSAQVEAGGECIGNTRWPLGNRARFRSGAGRRGQNLARRRRCSRPGKRADNIRQGAQ